MITLNKEIVPVTIFPDGTSQVWHLNDFLLQGTSQANVVWDFSSESEFLHLSQLKDLLDHYGFKSNLTLHYLPYARQDKSISNFNTFALHTFAKLINSLNFEEVFVLDPHSSIAIDLIKYINFKYPIEEVMNVFTTESIDLVCYPDKGAVEKYKHIYGLPYVFADKVREQSSGKILSLALHGDVTGKRVLTVDDLCDAGGTFKLVTQELLKRGASCVMLFVSHGLFTKGIRTLKDSGISKIFSPKGEHNEREQKIQF